MAEEGGRIALDLFRRDPRWRCKADHTPVSEADLAVDARLKAMLKDARPDDGWHSEESVDADVEARRRVWLVDPLDGTRGFLKGDPAFSVVVALIAGGRPLVAAIHAPALDGGKTWAAARGCGATLNGAPIHVGKRAELTGARVIGPACIEDPHRWHRPWPAVRRRKLPSLALRLAHVAAGDDDVLIALGAKHPWDIAAGDLMVREAGGVVSDATGARLRFDATGGTVAGLVAANAALHGQALALVKGKKAS